MGNDGGIDYSSYTLEQLEDALRHIDRASYPGNYQHLIAELERRRAAAEAARAAGVSAGVVRYRPEFRARPEEYFRIWIVNLALTIVTLGIYSAWAKVRKLRYFYGSTTLAGSAFGYHGDPIRILKGRIIAALLAAAYFGATRISPLGTLAMLAAIILATPWLTVKSRMFTMRVTSWRGLRFDFAADYAGAYRTLLGLLALGFVTLGLLMPWFICERYRFIVTRARYGETAFDCNASVGRFYKTAFGAFGLALVFLVPFIVVVAVVAVLTHDASASPAATRTWTLVPVALLYAVMLPAIHAYTQSRNLNEVFGKTTLGPHRLVASLGGTDLFWIYFSNLVLMVLTLGLYTPWAQIRLTRYRLQALELEAHGSLDEFVAAAAAPVPAAAGEEIGSFFDLDFGF